MGKDGLAEGGTVGRNRPSDAVLDVFKVRTLDFVDDLLAVPLAQIADAVLAVALGQLVEEPGDDVAEFHAGDDAVPHFGDLVGQNVVVVLVLLDVPVQPQRIQEAVACAFLDTHQFGDAGYGDDLVLNKVLQKLQALLERLNQSRAVSCHRFVR